jgi:hypothetical protein
MLRIVGCALVALAVGVPAASARSPLNAKDMKTIRQDARSKGRQFATAYGARTFTTSCRKTTLYSARCKIRLIDIRHRTHDCTITTVYVVTATHAIEGNLGRDGCA